MSELFSCIWKNVIDWLSVFWIINLWRCRSGVVCVWEREGGRVSCKNEECGEKYMEVKMRRWVEVKHRKWNLVLDQDLQKNGDIASFTFRPILNMDIGYIRGCAGCSQAIRSHHVQLVFFRKKIPCRQKCALFNFNTKIYKEYKVKIKYRKSWMVVSWMFLNRFYRIWGVIRGSFEP